MSAFTTVGTSRLGVDPSCTACGAGEVVSFNWAFAHERRSLEDMERIAPLVRWKSLRRGELYRCDVCDEFWHLDGSGQTMTHVSSTRLTLILAWDREPIKLADDLDARLEQIGPTPPDVYGNCSDRRVTPCKVVTTAGEKVDPAMICFQLDAPVQDYMHFRLGSEVAGIEVSQLALPLDVRLASSRAEEMRMGFSPSLIVMPDGKKYVLNGMTSFMSESGQNASDARVFEGSFFTEDPAPPFLRSPDITYFVVDGDPGWVVQQSGQDLPTKRSSWLRRLFTR
jgi:hypothetical protein